MTECVIELNWVCEIKCGVEGRGVRESSVSHFICLTVALMLPPHLPTLLPTPSSHPAPSSLLEALEQHLASLEGRKLKDLSTASRYVPITKTLLSSAAAAT